MKITALMTTVVSAAFAFSIPTDAENIKHSIDPNGNEHLSYSLGKIAVSSVKLHFKLSSPDSLSSADSVASPDSPANPDRLDSADQVSTNYPF